MIKKINTNTLRMVKSAKEILILQHADNEGPGSFADYFASKGWSLRTIHMGQTPLKLSDMLNAAAVISMGGPINVYETNKYPFLKGEEEFIQNSMTRHIPILGICLGAQILAKSCGAAVSKAPVKELGWYNVNLTDTGRKDPLFEGIAGQFTVFQYHEDTFAVPQSARLLAAGDKCANQAFCCGQHAYGLQFHLEVSIDMVKDWVSEPIARGDKEFNYDMIVKASEEFDGDIRIQAFDLCRNFEKIIVQAHA